MAKPNHNPRKPADDEEEDDVLLGKSGTPTAEEDWMQDEDEDPMEDDSLEIDEEEML